MVEEGKSYVNHVGLSHQRELYNWEACVEREVTGVVRLEDG